MGMVGYVDENLRVNDYDRLMKTGGAIIRLKLNVDQPVELMDFVHAFTALASEYERYKSNHCPDFKGESVLYVKEVRHGCVEADILSMLSVAIPTSLAIAENVNTVVSFVEHWGGVLKTLSKPNGKLKNTTKPQLENCVKQVAAVASVPNSSLEIAAIEIFKDGVIEQRALLKFSTKETKVIEENSSAQILDLSLPNMATHQRVMMFMARTDIGRAMIGKSTGERAVIESIGSKPRPIIYGSDLVEQRIKHEVLDEDDNVYNKTFVVDIITESLGKKLLAYRIIHVHQVIVNDGDE